MWPIVGLKKFETLSYLPTLTEDQLLKQIDYLLRSNWVPCLEFCKVSAMHDPSSSLFRIRDELGLNGLQIGFVWRENNRSPGYYDGRYWTMWKLPMFGCTDAVQVAKELGECKKEYPDAFIRIIGFDNNRQVQCISFIAYKPDAGAAAEYI